MSIGTLAKKAGVSTRTIRYYEEIGVLPVPDRSAGGSRLYHKEYVMYLEAIAMLKDIGFELDEIRLIELMRTGTASDDERRRIEQVVEERLGALEHRIKVLYWLHGILVGGTGKTQTLAQELVRRSKLGEVSK
jgi:DNA-binding transcriptional MerR regulator